MTRPLTTTSSDNPIALALYSTAVLFGILAVNTYIPTRTVTDFFRGNLGVLLWALTLSAAGIVSLVGSLGAKYASRNTRSRSGWLNVEALGALGVGLLFGIYLIALRYGAPTATGTQTLTLIPLLGCPARSWQVWRRDLPRLRMHRLHPTIADPPPPGDPTDRT